MAFDWGFSKLCFLYVLIFIMVSTTPVDEEPNCSKTFPLVGKVCLALTNSLLRTEKWKFSPSVLHETLPCKQEREGFIGNVHGGSFSVVRPSPLSRLTEDLRLVAVSTDALANILDLDPNQAMKSSDFLEFSAGNKLLPNSIPMAHRYGGHQFGEWAGQLGDGRAVLLGEYVNRKGERWEVQLKGSGKTPYSRQGDGRAVLRSSVREFLASEAMYYLYVPTSRAASLVTSGDKVWRDQFYDGHPQREQVAVVMRLAPSWFRVGSLEILTMSGEQELLRKTVDFIIEQHFPFLPRKNKYEHMLAEIVRGTAEMIAKWQSVGFTHGVCNTDNFSILSLTIDYGPFGFMEEYNPKFVPNTSDDEGRYSYEHQPHVGYFNMEKLAFAMAPLLLDKKRSLDILRNYSLIFTQKYLQEFRLKLGLLWERKEDEMLIKSLLWIMSVTKADFTMTFRGLSESTLDELQGRTGENVNWALKKMLNHPNWKDWVNHYLSRLAKNGPSDDDRKRRKRMQKVNPRYILRNWMAQIAIQKAEKGDYSEVRNLLKIFENPFIMQEAAELAGYASPSPDWAANLRVSCSS